MDKRIQENLAKGVEMHISGKFDLARQMYETAIKLQPEHADANHNMGLLKLDLGLDLEALPFLAVALQADTSIAQFWLSYTKTLIKLERYENATRILDLAEEAGFGEVEFLELRQQVQQIETSQRLEKGIEAHKSGQIQDAKDIYGDILKNIPDHSDANHNMGVLLSGQGKLEEAIIFFEKALKANASIEQYWVSYLETLVQLGQIEKAQKLAEEESPEGLSEVLVNRINGLISAQESDLTQPPPQETVDFLLNIYNEGQLMLAAEQAQVHLKQYPKSFLLWNVLGAAERGLGNNEQASKAFKKVTQLNPNFAGGFNNLGATLQDQGKVDDAIVAFEKAISLTPDYAEAYYNMANTVRDLGDLDNAIQFYKKAISFKPDFVDGLNNLGTALKDLDELEEALDLFRKSLILKPKQAGTYRNIGVVLRELGQLDEAIEAYDEALKIMPDYPEALCLKGNTLQEQEKLLEAIQVYDNAISLKHDYAEAYLGMGAALKDQGELERALQSVSKAISIAPNYGEAYNTLATILKDQGKLNAAIEEYKKAIALNFEDVIAHRNLSFTLLNAGEWKQGLDEYEWRMKHPGFATRQRQTSKPFWDGDRNLGQKTILVWSEQGPADIVRWSSALQYLIPIAKHCIIECPEKLASLFTRSFPEAEVRVENKNTTSAPDDFDVHLPIGSLYKHFLPEVSARKTNDAFLIPNTARIDYWKKRLDSLGKQLFVGISWKSPLMTVPRLPNYTKPTDWRPLMALPGVAFINLQSTDFEDDILQFENEFGVKINHFDDIDHYNDLDEVAALGAALDMCVSVSTAVSSITAGVGTPTKLLHWRQSAWNNILLTPTGPFVEVFERNTWETWSDPFNQISKVIETLVK